MFDLLLIVEDDPALGTEYLSIRLGFNDFNLLYKVFPLFAILFNHCLFA